MTNDFEDLKKIVKDNFSEAVFFDNGIISIPLETFNLTICQMPGDLYNLIFRIKILSLKDLKKRGDFAKACLCGNFFWNATNGAKLSVSAEDELFLTEKRALDEFYSIDDLNDCIEIYSETVNDWRIRSELYA